MGTEVFRHGQRRRARAVCRPAEFDLSGFWGKLRYAQVLPYPYLPQDIDADYLDRQKLPLPLAEAAIPPLQMDQGTLTQSKLWTC